ncbi:MAG TPA: hypothetical protein VGS19_37555 [Streptosporangiaceae bacterium]|nr:hypothetical protein [Streptosporangiaceae bacterium]
MGYCQVSERGAKSWTLENRTTLVITDRRTVFLTTQFDKGGGWVGFGAAGLAMALTANAVSKRRAAQRSAGKVAIGQIRHEWLTGITVRRSKALLTGIVDTHIDLMVATAAGPRVIDLWAPRAQGINEDFARVIVGAAAEHRLALLGPEPSADLSTLRRYLQGGQDAAGTGKPDDLGWSFPGKTDELIAAVISAQAPAPETRSGT